MDAVAGFNCRIFIPEDGFFVTGTEINGGDGGHASNPPDYNYVFATPVPVPENKIVLLVTFTFITFDANPKEIYFGPGINLETETMIIYDAAYDHNDTSQAAYPSSGSYDMPVFGINTLVVATDRETWGSIKALYR